MFPNKDCITVVNTYLIKIFINYQQLPGFDKMFSETLRLPWSQQGSVTFFISIFVFDQVLVFIIGNNINHLGVENIANLFSYEVINRLHILLSYQAFLHTVDNSQFFYPVAQLGSSFTYYFFKFLVFGFQLSCAPPDYSINNKKGT